MKDIVKDIFPKLSFTNFRRCKDLVQNFHNTAQLHSNKPNSGSAQVQTLPEACRKFAMVRISDNGPGWK